MGLPKRSPSHRRYLTLKYTSRRSRSLFTTVPAIFFALSIVLYSVALYLRDWPPKDIQGVDGQWWTSWNLTHTQRFLLVIAHPDDECLFFSPTLLNLLGRRAHLINGTSITAPVGHVLSLSTGNSNGLGPRRASELRASCWAMGISSDRCIAIDHDALPDSMTVWWSEVDIIDIVNQYIQRWNIQTIITFDDYGISGHANHRAVSAAITRAVHSNSDFPISFRLLSTNILAKYASLGSFAWSLSTHHRHRSVPLSRIPRIIPPPTKTLPITATKTTTPPPPTYSTGTSTVDAIGSDSETREDESLGFSNTSHPLSTHRTLFLSSPDQYAQARKAFAQHKSQNVWFRRLWLVTSRYMWWNELERIVPLYDRLYDVKSRQDL